jgi:hypothetical protein
MRISLDRHFQSKFFYSLARLSKNLYFHIPYKQIEDVILENASNTEQSIPHYCNISRRINRLDIKIEEGEDDYDDKSNLHITIL